MYAAPGLSIYGHARNGVRVERALAVVVRDGEEACVEVREELEHIEVAGGARVIAERFENARDRSIAKEPRDEVVRARPDVVLGEADGFGGVVFVVVGRRSGTF